MPANSTQGTFPSSSTGICVPTAPGAGIQPEEIPLEYLDAFGVQKTPSIFLNILVLLHPGLLP